MTYWYNGLASYNAKKTSLEAELKAAEEKLVEAKEGEKKNSWKWSARKEPVDSKEVARCKTVIATLTDQIAKNDEASATTRRIIADHEQRESELEETRIWAAEGFVRPIPGCIVVDEEAFHKEMAAGCESLRLCRPSLASSEEEEDEGEEAWEGPVDFNAYFRSLKPKVVEKPPEELISYTPGLNSKRLSLLFKEKRKRMAAKGQLA
jgi:hypothetical protein